MLSSLLVYALLAPLLLCKLLVPFVRRIALRNQWVDNPDNYRKTHKRPTPNIGGIAIAISFCVCLVGFVSFGDGLPLELSASTILVVSSAILIVGTGLYDDIFGLGFKQKFLVQIIVAYLILHAGYRIDVSGIFYMIDDPYQLSLFSMPLSLLWIVGILNAVNLLDGLDGLAAGVSTIAFLYLAMIWGIQGDLGQVTIALIMVGVLVGFLIYNYTPASIFMGDSGSLFLGFMLALNTMPLGSQVHENGIIAFFIPVMVLGLPILDTSTSFIRRYIAGHSPFAPDHNHIHHRLSRLTSRKYAVLIMYGLAIWFGTSALLASIFSTAVATIIVLSTLGFSFASIWLLQYMEEIVSRKATFDRQIHRFDNIVEMRRSEVVLNGELNEQVVQNDRYLAKLKGGATYENQTVLEVTSKNLISK